MKETLSQQIIREKEFSRRLKENVDIYYGTIARLAEQLHCNRDEVEQGVAKLIAMQHLNQSHNDALRDENDRLYSLVRFMVGDEKGFDRFNPPV